MTIDRDKLKEDKPEYLKGVNEIILRAYNLRQENKRNTSKIKEYSNINKVCESAKRRAETQIKHYGLEGIVDVKVEDGDSKKYVNGRGIIVNRFYYITFIGVEENKKIFPFTFNYMIHANYDTLNEFNNKDDGEEAVLKSNRNELEEELKDCFIPKPANSP